MVSFVYRGDNGADFQRRIVTHIQIHPSVTDIRSCLFEDSLALEEVKFPKGLQNIGCYAFHLCTFLKQALLPPTMSSIGYAAFADCKNLMEIRLPESGLFSIDSCAFAGCKSLVNVRIPHGVEFIQPTAFFGCTSLVSVEIPIGREILTILYQAFAHCKKLKNVRLPRTADSMEESALFAIAEDAFLGCDKLHEIYPTSLNSVLDDRFNGLPIHEFCYFQTSTPSKMKSSATYLEILDRMALMSVRQRDAFGMTPLHILALSTVPNLSLCQALCETQPDDLTAADEWGCLPMEYFTMNLARGMLPSVKCVLRALYAKKIGGLGLERWKTTILEAIDNLQWSNDVDQRKQNLSLIHSKVSRYWKKELASVLELAIWKSRLDAERMPTTIDDFSEEPPTKKVKSAKESTVGTGRTGKNDRQYCRMLCGSNVIIAHSLPFL